MTRLSRIIGIACVVFGLTSAPALASVVAQWTFESSAPITAGPFSPEVGAGSATGFHASTSTYSSPAGNGSAHSFSSNTWAVGDYYQFQVSTLGFNGISLSWDQTGSSTGPRDFQLSYSSNGTTFTNFGSVYSVLLNATPNAPWSTTGTPNAIYSFTYDLSAITGLDNQANAYFRLTNASTVSLGGNAGIVAAGGTGRVDNFTVSTVPLPAAAWLFGSGILALGGIARRRRGKA